MRRFRGTAPQIFLRQPNDTTKSRAYTSKTHGGTEIVQDIQVEYASLWQVPIAADFTCPTRAAFLTTHTLSSMI